MKLNLRPIIILLAFPLMVVLNGCDRDSSDPGDPVPFVRLLEGQSVQSTLLNRAISYAVLLPPEYETGTDNYPVVYLLHGYGNDEKAWYKGGNIKFYADKYAAETGPVIYVMPDGFNTYWVNKYNGNYPYMDMLITEMVPAIDAEFRTINDPAQRAVMGYSMGGYGALILPAKNPDIFKTAVALSMSFRTDQQYLNEPQGVFDSQWGTIFGGIGTTGDARLTDYFKEFSPFHFFENPDDLALSGQNYFIDCGDDEESLSETNGSLHNVLRNCNIPHEYRMRSGGHSWDYWQGSLPEALRYIGYAFRQVNYPSEGVTVDPGTPVETSRITEMQLPGNNISFKVVVPASYNTETRDYPVIYFLHDRETGNENNATQKLMSLMSKNIAAVRLPTSLIVEIPLQETEITPEILVSVVESVKESFRTFDEGKYAVLVGNKSAGKLAYELMPEVRDLFNACLLFDGILPTDASVNGPETGYYLDICDLGSDYAGYHSLYMSLRHHQAPYEYRVRQGTATHGDFLTGLDGAMVFIKDNLKN